MCVEGAVNQFSLVSPDATSDRDRELVTRLAGCFRPLTPLRADYKAAGSYLGGQLSVAVQNSQMRKKWLGEKG